MKQIPENSVDAREALAVGELAHSQRVASGASQLAEQLERELAEERARLDKLEEGLPFLQEQERDGYAPGDIVLWGNGRLMRLVQNIPNGLHWESITWRAAIDAATADVSVPTDSQGGPQVADK